MEGAPGGMEDWGSRALCISRIGAELQPEATRPRDDFALEVPATSFFSDTEFNIPTPADPPTQDTL